MKNKLSLENGIGYELSDDELRVIFIALKMFDCADTMSFCNENKKEDYKIALKNLLSLFEHIDF